MKTDVKIGPVLAKSGSIAHGRLEIAKSFDESMISMPLTIINGSSDGPKVWIQAAIHGDEVSGIEAIKRIIASVNPKELKGAVIAVPIVNTTAFEFRRRESPIDNKDANRVSPGNPKGTFSERLAYTLLEQAKSCDYVLDLHGGGILMELLPHVEYGIFGGELGKKIEAIAKATGIETLWGIEECISPWKERYAGTLCRELKTRSIPCIYIEAGNLCLFQESAIEVHYQAVLNIMRYLGMLKGTAKPSETQRIVRQVERVAPTSRGLWIPKVSVGGYVMQEDVLALVTDISGNTVEEIRAPIEGLVLIMRPQSLVDPLSDRFEDNYGAMIGN